jgi:hypothetical protein
MIISFARETNLSNCQHILRNFILLRNDCMKDFCVHVTVNFTFTVMMALYFHMQ